MVSRIIPVSSFDLVLFGATGDLARRKILPALYRRLLVGQMQPGSRVIGVARRDLPAPEFCDLVRKSITEHVPSVDRDAEKIETFCRDLSYVPVDVGGENGWEALKNRVLESPNEVRAFYLSVGPSLFGPIANRLTQNGIADSQSRIVIEKPFGHDLASARELNAQLAGSFDESQNSTIPIG